MSASSIPLKIKNTNGDLQEFTPLEENYLSYAVGQALADASAGEVGDISLTGNVNIGSFTDAYFNESAGTHPISNITSTTVTTTLTQEGGTADETGADFVRPVGYYDSSPNPGFYEMADGDLDNLASRVLSNMVQNDYVGTFKLSSTSPGADYTVFLSNVFSDTHGDGTVTSYNIYQRTSMPVVNAVRPVAICYDGSSNFDGFKEMSDTQVKYTLGQRVKTLRATAGAIGSYQFRSSAQGVPILPGTWVSVGNATNTRRTIVDNTYSRTRASSYARTRISAYTRDRVSTYTRNSVDTFSRTFIGDYTGTYTRDFIGNYSRDFVGEYTRTRPSSYEGTYIRNRISTYSADYTRTRVTPLTRGTYARTRTSAYTHAMQTNRIYWLLCAHALLRTLGRMLVIVSQHILAIVVTAFTGYI